MNMHDMASILGAKMADLMRQTDSDSMVIEHDFISKKDKQEYIIKIEVRKI